MLLVRYSLSKQIYRQMRRFRKTFSILRLEFFPSPYILADALSKERIINTNGLKREKELKNALSSILARIIIYIL